MKTKHEKNSPSESLLAKGYSRLLNGLTQIIKQGGFIKIFADAWNNSVGMWWQKSLQGLCSLCRLVMEKSTLASVSFPAWHLGRNPEHEFISCSYSGSLAMGSVVKFVNYCVSQLTKQRFKHALTQIRSRLKRG